MSRTTRYLRRKAIERAPAPVLDLVGRAVVQAVDRAVEDRWDRALAVAAEAEGDTVEARIRSISRRFRTELGAMGAASGAVAAAPGLGTGAAVTALVADLGWFAMRATDLIMAIGAVNGHTASTVEERRAWVLAILAYGEDAAVVFATLLDEIDTRALVGGERISARLAGLAGGDAATLDALRRVNARLAAKVIARYGSRRSLLAAGKLLPFGVGAVVGGSVNYAVIRIVGFQTARFFASYGSQLPSPPPPTLQAPSPPAIPPPTLQAPSPPAIPPPAPRTPPPPAPGSERLPNPPATLSETDRRNAIPTTGDPS